MAVMIPRFMPQYDQHFFTQQFFKPFVEALSDNESNETLLSMMNHFPDDVSHFLYLQECNERFMLVLISSTIHLPSRRVNERLLKKRAELMVRFVIRNDQYLLKFLCNLSARCESAHGLPLTEMDRVVQTLLSEGVISCFVANHWLLARSDPAQLGTYESRRQVIHACLLLKKQFNHCDTEDEY